MAENSHTNIKINQIDPTILKEAQQFIWSLFNQKHDARLVYHQYGLAHDLAVKTEEICRQNAFSENTLNEAKLLAWFYASGILFDYHTPTPKSAEILHKFLKAKSVPPKKTSQLTEAILRLSNHGVPTTKSEQCLFDAIQAVHFGERFSERSPLWHLERELMTNQVISKKVWASFLLDQLLQVHFFTPYAKVHFEPVVAQNILTQRQAVEKAGKSVEVSGLAYPRKFQGLERKIPGSGIQTYFRTNYRNHINLSAIADGKANIMITVNALLISVVISILTYKNITETTPGILFPSVIFIFTGLASMVFAILSARPKVTALHTNDTPIEEVKKNIVFFGNFARLNLNRYEEALDAVFRDSELLYGNLARDLYYMGKVLDQKYRYLTISYNIFMVGFVFTVLTFLMLLFV